MGWFCFVFSFWVSVRVGIEFFTYCDSTGVFPENLGLFVFVQTVWVIILGLCFLSLRF